MQKLCSLFFLIFLQSSSIFCSKRYIDTDDQKACTAALFAIAGQSTSLQTSSKDDYFYHFASPSATVTSVQEETSTFFPLHTSTNPVATFTTLTTPLENGFKIKTYHRESDKECTVKFFRLTHEIQRVAVKPSDRKPFLFDLQEKGDTISSTQLPPAFPDHQNHNMLWLATIPQDKKFQDEPIKQIVKVWAFEPRS